MSRDKDHDLDAAHHVLLPNGDRVSAPNYQAAWLLRRREAWARGLSPHDLAIVDDDGTDRTPPKTIAEHLARGGK